MHVLSQIPFLNTAMTELLDRRGLAVYRLKKYRPHVTHTTMVLGDWQVVSAVNSYNRNDTGTRNGMVLKERRLSSKKPHVSTFSYQIHCIRIVIQTYDDPLRYSVVDDTSNQYESKLFRNPLNVGARVGSLSIITSYSCLITLTDQSNSLCDAIWSNIV